MDDIEQYIESAKWAKHILLIVRHMQGFSKSDEYIEGALTAQLTEFANKIGLAARDVRGVQ